MHSHFSSMVDILVLLFLCSKSSSMWSSSSSTSSTSVRHRRHRHHYFLHFFLRLLAERAQSSPGPSPKAPSAAGQAVGAEVQRAGLRWYAAGRFSARCAAGRAAHRRKSIFCVFFHGSCSCSFMLVSFFGPAEFSREVKFLQQGTFAVRRSRLAGARSNLAPCRELSSRDELPAFLDCAADPIDSRGGPRLRSRVQSRLLRRSESSADDYSALVV